MKALNPLVSIIKSEINDDLLKSSNPSRDTAILQPENLLTAEYITLFVSET